MSWLEILRKAADMIDLSKRPDYHVNKWLFRGALGVILLLAALCVRLDGWGVLTNKVYANAAEVEGEPWPVYEKDCHEENISDCIYISENAVDQVPPGMLLKKEPSFYTKHFALLTLLIFGIALLLNKVLYNRGRRLFEFKVNEEEGGEKDGI